MYCTPQISVSRLIAQTRSPIVARCFGHVGAWYVAYVRSGDEDKVAAKFRRRNYLSYVPYYRSNEASCPLTSTLLGSHEKWQTKEPLFPRHIFFRPTKSSPAVEDALKVDGVITLIRLADEYAAISAETIEVLQEWERQRDHKGFRGSLPTTGQGVYLRESKLHRLNDLMHCASSQRIAVLMELLGHVRAPSITPVRSRLM